MRAAIRGYRMSGLLTKFPVESCAENPYGLLGAGCGHDQCLGMSVEMMVRACGFLRPLIALPVLGLALSGCAQFGRMPGETDSQCVQRQMAHGNNDNGPLPFVGAASACMQMTKGQDLTGYGSEGVPLDLRDSPELQKMAEDPEINYAGYPYIPRDSKEPPVGARWHIMQ